MKISLTKFYQEVTGTRTCNMKTTVPALKRWGVPAEAIEPVGSGTRFVIDWAYAEVARKGFAEEKANPPKRPRSPAATAKAAATTKAKQDVLAAVLGRLTAIEELLQSIGVTVERINERTFHEAKASAGRKGH